ncbi:MAG: hypothetical protein K1X83_08370 [Oligoflexia bacterium]|nr:hypothetical protein [Oligoflexia bacterium]
MNTNQINLGPRLRIAQLISVGFISFVGALMLVGGSFDFDGVAAASQNQLPIWPLIIAGILAAGLSLKVHDLIFRAQLKRISGSSASSDAIFPIYFITLIVGSALREAVAVAGLILTMQTGERGWVMLFGAAATLLILKAWPKASDLQPASS